MPKSESTLKRPYLSASGPDTRRPTMLAAFMMATMCVAMAGLNPTRFAYDAMVKNGTKKLMNSTPVPTTNSV